MDMNKVKAIAKTYLVIAVPFATAAFTTNSSLTVKILSILSGVLGVTVRGLNPKDPAFGMVTVAKAEVDAQIAKESAKKTK